MAKVLTSGNFEAEVLGAQKPVLVDFWATWCGPCKRQAPIFEALSEELAGKVKFGSVNVDEQAALALKYQVMSIPTLIIFKGGQEVKRLIGLHSEEQIRLVLDQI